MNVPEPQRPLLPPGTTCRPSPRPPEEATVPSSDPTGSGRCEVLRLLALPRAGPRVRRVPAPVSLRGCWTAWVCAASRASSRCQVRAGRVRACRAAVPSRTHCTERQAPRPPAPSRRHAGLAAPALCNRRLVLDAVPWPVTWGSPHTSAPPSHRGAHPACQGVAPRPGAGASRRPCARPPPRPLGVSG